MSINSPVSVGGANPRFHNNREWFSSAVFLFWFHHTNRNASKQQNILLTTADQTFLRSAVFWPSCAWPLQPFATKCKNTLLVWIVKLNAMTAEYFFGMTTKPCTYDEVNGAYTSCWSQHPDATNKGYRNYKSQLVGRLCGRHIRYVWRK